jgi:hypothetical protein
LPLPTPVARELQHTRTLDLKAYRRDDGLWDIEGHLTDVKPFAYPMLDATRDANEPIHDMWLRLTIDQQMTVREAVAHMDTGAHFVCHRVTPNFAALAGLKIGAGWNRKVRERVGRTHGCTHLIEMLQQMATTAMQALWADDDADAAATPADRREMPSGMENACFAYRTDGEYVEKFFPRFYRPMAPVSDDEAAG